MSLIYPLIDPEYSAYIRLLEGLFLITNHIYQYISTYIRVIKNYMVYFREGYRKIPFFLNKGLKQPNLLAYIIRKSTINGICTLNKRNFSINTPKPYLYSIYTTLIIILQIFQIIYIDITENMAYIDNTNTANNAKTKTTKGLKDGNRYRVKRHSCCT